MSQFFVAGRAVPQGSKKAFLRGGRVRLVESAGRELKRWRADVCHKAEVMIQAGAWEPPSKDVPVSVTLTFVCQRPSGHWLRTGAFSATGRARDQPVVRPDLDKLVRAVLDAMTDAGVWHDDSQVCSLSAAKVYESKHTGKPGVWVSVARMVRAA